MRISVHGFGRDGLAPGQRSLKRFRRFVCAVLTAICLSVLPADLRFTSDSGIVGIGMAEAIAQNRGDGNERSAPSDRDMDRGGGRDDRGGNGDDQHDRNAGDSRASRSVSVPDPARTPGTGSVTPTISGSSSTTVRAPVEGGDGPGHAPTEAGTARTRAMVEIAKEMGAIAPSLNDSSPISSPVTQEMLDVAEAAYVATVQEAWEAHGFPWTDPDVLRSLGELEALVSSLETIMASTDPNPGSRPAIIVPPDINNDGFVDINDLWDAHRW